MNFAISGIFETPGPSFVIDHRKALRFDAFSSDAECDRCSHAADRGLRLWLKELRFVPGP
jgi:hypothetical protein